MREKEREREKGAKGGTKGGTVITHTPEKAEDGGQLKTLRLMLTVLFLLLLLLLMRRWVLLLMLYCFRLHMLRHWQKEGWHSVFKSFYSSDNNTDDIADVFTLERHLSVAGVTSMSHHGPLYQRRQ